MRDIAPLPCVFLSLNRVIAPSLSRVIVKICFGIVFLRFRFICFIFVISPSDGFSKYVSKYDYLCKMLIGSVVINKMKKKNNNNNNTELWTEHCETYLRI